MYNLNSTVCTFILVSAFIFYLLKTILILFEIFDLKIAGCNVNSKRVIFFRQVRRDTKPRQHHFNSSRMQK